MNKKILRVFEALISRAIGDVNCLNLFCKTRVIDKNTYYDSLTDLVIRKVLKKTSICVDVGCHTGTVLNTMMKYASSGNFYCFEPLPNFCENLKTKYGHLESVSIFEIALSDVKGDSSFNYVVTNPGYSGLIKRRYDRPNEEDIKIEVKTDLMDTLIQNVTIDLIKIDVEGAELQVLRGAKEIIKRDKPFIIFEHGLGAADYYGATPEELYYLLHDCCDLNITLLDRYLRSQPSLLKNEFCDQFYKGINYYFLAYKGCLLPDLEGQLDCRR